jgi:general secretion pathway protein K
MNRERGSILLLALWLLVVLSGVALAMATTVSTDAYLARNLADDARAKYLAQAAIHRHVLTLMSSRDPGRKLLGKKKVEVLGTSVDLDVVDECGKVDINTGWGLLLRNVVAAAGRGVEAESLGQAILDWRDPDKRRRTKGAEADDYSSAGRSYTSGDTLFDTVDELQLVLGMTPQIYSAIEPMVTVDCLNAGIDPMLAPPAVLAAVPGMEPGLLQAFLQAREQAPQDQEEAVVDGLGDDRRYFDISPQQSFAITATVARPSGGSTAWRAVVWITGDAQRPFLCRTWRQVPSPSP